MKTRNGFVSNSSSSSYIVVLPEGFSFQHLDLSSSNESMEDWGLEEDDVKVAFDKLMADKEVYFYDFEGGRVLAEILHDYVITTMNSGPDEGILVILDREKLRSKLEAKL